MSSAEFALISDELTHFGWRPEVLVEQIPSPQRIAPFSVAVEADICSGTDEIGSGRLIILHDPAGNDAWRGEYRLVSLARAGVDAEMAADPLLPEVGWSWLKEALTAHGAQFCAASGTVTTMVSRGFGEIAEDPDRLEIEIRASWTPLLGEGGIHPHLAAWQYLLCLTAGLPPLPEGVIPLSPRMGRLR